MGNALHTVSASQSKHRESAERALAWTHCDGEDKKGTPNKAHASSPVLLPVHFYSPLPVCPSASLPAHFTPLPNTRADSRLGDEHIQDRMKSTSTITRLHRLAHTALENRTQRPRFSIRPLHKMEHHDTTQHGTAQSHARHAQHHVCL